MEYLSIISVPAIVAAVYAIIEVIKKATNNNEKVSHFYPLIGLVLGVISGVICYYFIPDIIAAPNVVLAIILGGASGLAATGTNQILKQLTDKNKKK
jgi:hypothetical protein